MSLEKLACGKAEALHGVLTQPLSAAALFDALLPSLGGQLRLCVSQVMRIQLRRLVAVLYDRQPFVRAATTLSVDI